MTEQRSPEVYLNLNVRGMGHSATLAINEHSRRLLAQGRRVYRLGLGQSPFPVPEHVRDSLARNAHQKDYLPVMGLQALREAVVAWVKRTEGLDYAADNVLVGPGTKELMFLMQLVYYGDLVIPSPSWVSYAPQARIIGRHIHWLRTRPEAGLGVEPDALEELCARDPNRPRLLILNSPGNPTGHCYDAAQLQALTAVLRKYRVLVLSDEIYSGTHYTNQHVSLARYYPEGTIISNGLSKWCGAGGWRLGFLVFPEGLSWLAKAMAAVASETFTSTAAPIQYAAVTALEERPEMRDYLAHSRRVLGALSSHARRTLTAAGATVNRAAGGFYLFPHFERHRPRLEARGIVDGAALCQTLLEDTGVAVLPGQCFGRPPGELSMRLAIVDFDGAGALEAAVGEAVDDAFVTRHCARVTDAVEQLARWVEQ
ncbi:pyridoxal phosphate-dependent aminotransferase [Parahaliea mediterranea]|uniref:Aminotransferase n=1 Tax=Parahaliea mediterranea TaxID=651086 RepID=A0A939INH8_9GAMM|nr:aminotransferase class I/II-fold pyridoxal phosphate-dependent enzyme [Parahaliea mediterranea]MBN7798138.1 aminotransferase class I/II-fold pyridoxal phosphate-dependent enzyme [Parahaliea mediterranea]